MSKKYNKEALYYSFQNIYAKFHMRNVSIKKVTEQ